MNSMDQEHAAVAGHSGAGLKTGPILNGEDLQHLTEQEQTRQVQCKARIFVCMGTACQSCQSGEVLAALSDEVKRRRVEQEYLVTPGGCQGNCAEAPIL